MSNTSVSLLIGLIVLMLLALVVGVIIPSEREKSAYAGGLCMGALLMFILAAFMASKSS